MTNKPSRVLVTDFDGTMTRRDFFECVTEQLLQPEDMEPWHRYNAGKISHFEALQTIFSKLRFDESQLQPVLDQMGLDPRLAKAVDRLRQTGWEIVVVSNGCRWYIDRLLGAVKDLLTLYTNPGTLDPAQGLLMRRPVDSPYYGEATGIDKRLVVQDFLARYDRVVFAGNGRPDVEPALLVEPANRFARGYLALELERCERIFRRFESWSEIADQLALRGN